VLDSNQDNERWRVADGAGGLHKTSKRGGALLAVLCLSSLLVATIWDADGDPTTDNLPSVTFVVDSRATASTHEAHEPTGNDGEETPSLLGCIRAWFERLITVLAHRKGLTAVPVRGP
jgi:hypothetical protein